MIDLPNVTLFATCSAEFLELTHVAMKRCLGVAKFGDAILFSENAEGLWDEIRIIRIDRVGGRNESGVHYFKNLPEFLKTTHVLVIDWDSWIVNPGWWTKEFLIYDYIGARWPWLPAGRNIGNGGFALMSRRLLETVRGLPEFLTSKGLDVEIGQVWRDKLEDRGLKFPSEYIADRFSKECVQNWRPSFGFHAMFNFWRYLSDDEMLGFVRGLPGSVVRRKVWLQTIKAYVKQGRWRVVWAMVQRWLGERFAGSVIR